jgi:GT2 family glycosyltransferase
VDDLDRDFPGVILIRNKSNAGFGSAGNTGARRATGDYIIFLNQDTVVESNWVEGLLEPFAKDPRVGLVTPKVLLLDQPERINTCGNTVHFTGLTTCRGLNHPRDSFAVTDDVDAISGATFAIRRELFELLKGFDEETFLYMEDTDLSWRAWLAGWGSTFTPNSVVFHDYRLRLTPMKIFYQERNRYLMLLKNLTWPTLIVLLPALMLAEFVTWGFVLLNDRKNIGNKVRAYWWILSNWKNVLRKRRETQMLRQTTDRELLRHTTFKLQFQEVDRGVAGTLANHVFNPIFFLLRSMVMGLVRW